MSFALLLLGNLCFVVETALVLWTIIKPTTDEKTCRLQEKLTNTMMAVAFYPIYLFLWSRQLSIYRDRRLASALPVWLRAFSKFTLFMIVSTLTGFVVILGSTLADPKKIDFKDGYCIKVDDTWSVAAAIGTMVIIQSLLLFLFWYPIMTALSTGHSSLGQYVRRCAILTLINSLSDVTTLAFMLVFMNTAPVPLLAVVYPINLMVNCCCCIFSYRGGSIPGKSLAKVHEKNDQPSCQSSKTHHSCWILYNILRILTWVLLGNICLIIFHHIVDPPACGVYFYRLLPAFDAFYLLVAIFGLVAMKVDQQSTYSFFRTAVLTQALIFVANLLISMTIQSITSIDKSLLLNSTRSDHKHDLGSYIDVTCNCTSKDILSPDCTVFWDGLLHDLVFELVGIIASLLAAIFATLAAENAFEKMEKIRRAKLKRSSSLRVISNNKIDRI
ncbi:Oidioi.mRNA.OKI2018_I69.chr1.g2057.t1.cds [Oikopleura dioica]|uniref:Oidioi.mRNA.OKI2018_I69.chr1.g2057.t1.cds n=1 Tax=Oikopleura dioica TaxID=34765 RepID=A0ABN7SPX1_OIKDI|nr:Oidioi.mRNA.OKI2018_I69.chr1.g2057.t1.cds [Oikopleura dioica]